jgi:glycerate dehydrogenase
MKDMNKIVILDGYTADPSAQAWQALEEMGELTVYERTKVEETVARAKDAEIVLTNKVILGRKEMEQMPCLRYIGVLATGYNVVDLEAASERGIVVTNVPAYSTESVAQMVFSHLLTVTNHTEHYASENRQGRWTKSPDFCYWDAPLTELAGKTFGIVGLGNIGQHVAAIAHAFGMKVVAQTSKAADMLPEYASTPSYASEMRSFGPSMVKMVRLFWKSRFVFVQFPVAPSVNAQLQDAALLM